MGSGPLCTDLKLVDFGGRFAPTHPFMLSPCMADWGGASTSTLYKPAHGQNSIEDKVRGQQYLTVEEEKALVSFLLLMSSF
jgi:hypothetical protein